MLGGDCRHLSERCGGKGYGRRNRKKGKDLRAVSELERTRFYLGRRDKGGQGSRCLLQKQEELLGGGFGTGDKERFKPVASNRYQKFLKALGK